MWIWQSVIKFVVSSGQNRTPFRSVPFGRRLNAREEDVAHLSKPVRCPRDQHDDTGVKFT
jgi:hypothetical protein